MQNKSIVVRLNKEQLDLIRNDAKKQGVTNSQVVRDALQIYYNPVQTIGNQDLITVLNNEISDLRGQRDMLQQRCDYYSLPWYIRLLKSRPQLPP